MNIWIWGIGASGKFVYRYLHDKGLHVKGIIDNNPVYWNFSYGGLRVAGYDEQKSFINTTDILIICAGRDKYEHIKNQLASDGISNGVWMYEYIDDPSYTNRVLVDQKKLDCSSKLCDSTDFDDTIFRDYYNRIQLIPKFKSYHIIFHRKMWEWCYIAATLKKARLLEDNRKGIGFAVGTEPLPSLFASEGVCVTATDLCADTDEAMNWSVDDQNAGSDVDNLYYKELCKKKLFYKNVEYYDVDMNYIPDEICNGQYDFCWSSCAIEHVGSLEKSKRFLMNMIKCLKPGGVAVHTTEFNLSSDVDTIEYGGSVIWRRRDVEEIKDYFNSMGCNMEVSYYRTDNEANNYIDLPPFKGECKPYHMNLVIDGYLSTSIALVIRNKS